MFSQCANPDCEAGFDYREGHLYRFHKDHAANEPPPNTHSVQHFWLCAECCLRFTLEYREREGVILRSRAEQSYELPDDRLIAAA